MKPIFVLLLLCTNIYGYSQILNVESFRIRTDTTGWAGKIGLDVSLVKNTKTLTKIGGKAHLQYKTVKSLILLMGQYELLSSNTNDLIDKSVLHLRYNYKIRPKMSFETFMQGQKNSISKIDFRGLIGLGLRFKLSKNENFRYYLGSTAMYEHEITSLNTDEQHWRWSNYFSFTIMPVNYFSIISTTYYQPVFSYFSDYRIASQNALIFKIDKHLSFKTAFNYYFDSTPVEGVPKEQYNLNSGILYAF